MPTVAEIVKQRSLSIADIVRQRAQAPTTQPQAPPTPLQAPQAPVTSAQAPQVPPVAPMAPEQPQDIFRNLQPPTDFGLDDYLQDPSDFRSAFPPEQPDDPETKAIKARIKEHGEPTLLESIWQPATRAGIGIGANVLGRLKRFGAPDTVSPWIEVTSTSGEVGFMHDPFAAQRPKEEQVPSKQAFTATGLKAASAAMKSVIDAHPEWQKRYVERGLGIFTNPKAVISTFFEAVPYMGATIGLMAVGGVAPAFVFTYAVESQSAYDDAIASGIPEDQAGMIGDIAGLANAAIELLQARGVLTFATGGKQAFTKYVNQHALKVAQRSGAEQAARLVIGEALEEAAQQGVNEITPWLVAGKAPEPGVVSRMYEAAIQGGIAAGGLAGGGRAATAVGRKLAPPPTEAPAAPTPQVTPSEPQLDIVTPITPAPAAPTPTEAAQEVSELTRLAPQVSEPTKPTKPPVTIKEKKAAKQPQVEKPAASRVEQTRNSTLRSIAAQEEQIRSITAEMEQITDKGSRPYEDKYNARIRIRQDIQDKQRLLREFEEREGLTPTEPAPKPTEARRLKEKIRQKEAPPAPLVQQKREAKPPAKPTIQQRVEAKKAKVQLPQAEDVLSKAEQAVLLSPEAQQKMQTDYDAIAARALKQDGTPRKNAKPADLAAMEALRVKAESHNAAAKKLVQAQQKAELKAWEILTNKKLGLTPGQDVTVMSFDRKIKEPGIYVGPEKRGKEIYLKVKQKGYVSSFASSNILETAPAPPVEAKAEKKGPIASKVAGDIPVSMEPAGKPVSAASIIASVQKEFGIPIRVGHMAQPRHIGGIFKVKPEVVRLREANDLAIASHEIAHYIDKITHLTGLGGRDKTGGTLSRTLRHELAGLDYDKKQRRSSEGFAEYVRLYLTTEEAAEKAPTFDMWFRETFLPAHPDIAAKLETTRGRITRWRDQGAQARVLSAISKAGKAARPEGVTLREWAKDKLSRAYHRLRSWFITDLDAVEQFERGAETALGEKLSPAERPSLWMGVFSQSAPSMANAAVEGGVHSLITGKKIGPSVREAFEKLGRVTRAEFEEFTSFIYARHALDVLGKGKNPGISKGDAQYVYDQHKDRLGWKEASDILIAYNKALVKVLGEVGRLSPEAEQQILDAYPAYIPLKRVMDNLRKAGRGGRGVVNVASPIKRLKGSGRQIINPLEAMIAQTEHIYGAAAKTLAAQKLIDLQARGEGLGSWVERIPPDKITQHIALEQIEKQLQALGVDLGDADMTAMISLTTVSGFYRGGEPIALIYRDGKAEWYQFDKDLYRAITSMDYYRLPWLLESLLGKPKRAIQLGATGLNVAFTSRNLLRDTGTFVLNAEYARGPFNLARPLVETFKYAGSEFREFSGGEADPLVAMWKRYGGPIAQPLGLDLRHTRRKVMEVLRSAQKRNAINVAKHPIEGVREVLGITEAGGRLAEFKAALKSKGWDKARIIAEGSPPMVVVMEAMNAANDVTVDFKRMGTVGKVLNRMIPFFNASIQGTSKTVRTFRGHPVRTMLRGLAYLTIPTLAYWWYTKDEEWYDELEAWQKYGFWNFKVGPWIIKIPRPFDHGLIFSGAAEAAAEAARASDTQPLEDFSEFAADQVAPPLMPALIRPFIEVAFNYNMWLERPIVPERQKRLEPRDQYAKYNTWLSKQIGDFLNYSPAKLDHLMSAYTGGLLTGVVRQTEAAIRGFEGYTWPDVPGIGGFITRREGSQSVDQFYEQREEITRTYNSARLRGAIPAEVVAKYQALNKVASRMSKLRKQARELDLSDAADKKARITSIYKSITGLARAALGKQALSRYVAPPAPVKKAKRAKKLRRVGPG